MGLLALVRVEDHRDAEEESEDNRSYFIWGVEPEAPVNFSLISTARIDTDEAHAPYLPFSMSPGSDALDRICASFARDLPSNACK